MTGLESHVDDIQRDGYTVLPGVYSADQCQALHDAYPVLCAQASVPGGPPAAWLGNLLEAAPGLFWPMISHPVVWSLAEALMGPLVQLEGTAFNRFPRVPADQAQGRVSGWHRDRYAFVPQTTAYQRPWCINAITYLQGLHVDSGALRVVPGSHRDPVVVTAEERAQPHPRERLLYPQPGDVVVTHGQLLHSGTPHSGSADRDLVSISYNLCWLRHRDNLSGPRVEALIDCARARNDRRMLRLLGADPLLWERSNPYFASGDDASRWARWVVEDRAALAPSPLNH